MGTIAVTLNIVIFWGILIYNMFVADKNIMYSWAAQNSSQRVNIFQ